MSPLKRWFFLLLAALLFLALSFTMAACRAQPVMTELALDLVTDCVSKTIYDSVNEIMAREQVTYRELVTLEKDDEGEITAVLTNIAAINLLQSQVSNTILAGLEDSERTAIGIPLGNLFGGTFLSGRGPDIPVRILAVTDLTTGFRNDFAVAGINQTLHTIYLTIDVSVSILMPGTYSSETVSSEVSIAETIIVGEVPSTYAEFGGK